MDKPNHQNRAARRAAERAEKKKAEELEKAHAQADLIATIVISRAEQARKDNPDRDGDPDDILQKKALIFGGTVGISILGILVWTLGAPLNYYGGRPWILYLPAVGVFAALLYGTHKFIKIFKKSKWLYLVNLFGIGLVCITFFIVRNENAQKAQAVAEARHATDTLNDVGSNMASLPSAIVAANKSQYQGELVPANDPFPHLPAEVPTDGMMLLLGKSVNVVRHFPHTVIMWRDKPALQISTNSQGASISAEFFDRKGTIVATLESNRFNINPLNSFRLERPDKSTLKVRDQQDVVVLDVRFMNFKLIKLNGVLRFPNGQEAVIDENHGIFSMDSFMWDNFVDVYLE